MEAQKVSILINVKSKQLSIAIKADEMKILYIHQYFKTPKEPGGTRSYWISRELIKRGHKVTVLTTREDQEKDREVSEIDGIIVISFNVPYSQNMGVRQRLKAFTNFMLKASKEGLKYQEVDLIIATSTPLTVGYPAMRIKNKLNIPFIFEVRDLWPEVPIQMGALNNSLVQRFARWFERKVYRESSHVIALSPGMQDGVVKYIPKEKTSMIPNMAKIDEFWPRDPNFVLMAELGLQEESFKVIHFGSLGLANGADYIVDAANLMKDSSNVEFIFLGGGSTEETLQNKCQQLGLNNVKFLGRYPMKTTSEIVNLCDVSLVSFMDLPILYTNSPNKLFDSLSAGKPIIVNSAGWTKDLVEKNGCGFFAHPARPQELVERIIFLKNNSEEKEKMGKKARELAENTYDKTILCSRFADVVEGVFSTCQKSKLR